MTLEEMAGLFLQFSDETLTFERVETKRSSRRDLHAFLLLDELVRGDMPMISAAEHDQVWLDVDMEALAAIASADTIRELVRCGIFYDEEFDCLSRFV